MLKLLSYIINDSPFKMCSEFVLPNRFCSHIGVFYCITSMYILYCIVCYCSGCPHQEAVLVMVDQVTLLHNQLVFECNQCLQHAARNRQLLSILHKAGADKEDLLAMVRR